MQLTGQISHATAVVTMDKIYRECTISQAGLPNNPSDLQRLFLARNFCLPIYAEIHVVGSKQESRGEAVQNVES